MTIQEIIARFESGELFNPDSLAFCYEHVKHKGGMPTLPKNPPAPPIF